MAGEQKKGGSETNQKSISILGRKEIHRGRIKSVVTGSRKAEPEKRKGKKGKMSYYSNDGGWGLAIL